ncbi:uncharacterized protein LOC119113166 [Pollicipes pollicipes]|uniref:uncharacterized protein LOC119113166 n=1 Tax=Pollicipes pollicipes TaxID=41117 RepID=UPI00188494D1|nr:uncharacterized protein LOC119113166 [Pollicipes pollicipes]
MRLQTTSLVHRRSAGRPAAAVASSGPDFKRFRRTQQPPPPGLRVILGTDLKGYKRRTLFTNGDSEADESDERRDESRRREMTDDELLRVLDSVARGGRGR